MSKNLLFKNNILFTKRNGIIVEDSFKSYPNQDIRYISTILKNLEYYGYTLHKDIITKLSYYSNNELVDFYKNLITIIESNLPKQIYDPMYLNFPQEVMDMDESTLYFDAMMHYIGDAFGVRIMPKSEKIKRFPLIENVDLKVINLLSNEDFGDLLYNLMNSSTSISEYDKQIISDCIKFFDISEIIPTSFNHKEVMVHTLVSLIKYNKFEPNLYKLIKTPTDLLRLCIGLSDGDISLSEKSKFRNFKRKERRIILNILNDIKGKYIVEEMTKYKSIWIRLGEKLHPGDYKNQFLKSYNYFNILRNHKTQTVNSYIENVITNITNNVDIEENLEYLCKFPGDFARNLNRILSECNNYEFIINSFKSIIDKVSTNVLLQLKTFFIYRGLDPVRVFLPKGNVTKSYIISNNLKYIDTSIIHIMLYIIDMELIKRFSKLDKMGKVYIDKELENYTIPFSQRSASKTLKTISRGSRIPFKNNIRFFIYWKDGVQRTDIDLSCVFLDENMKFISKVSYTHKRNEYSVHSGDITSAPNGASEFIDVDMKKAKKMGVKYIIPSVLSFTQQPYCDLPECFFGWMERENMDFGEIYEPKTVKNIFDLSSNVKIVIPTIIDIDNKEVIWCDLGVKENVPSTFRNFTGFKPNNIENNMNSLISSCIAFIYLRKTDIYSVLQLHALGRGEIVNDPDEADIVFSIDNNTHTKLDILMSEYLN